MYEWDKKYDNSKSSDYFRVAIDYDSNAMSYLLCRK